MHFFLLSFAFVCIFSFVLTSFPTDKPQLHLFILFSFHDFFIFFLPSFFQLFSLKTVFSCYIFYSLTFYFSLHHFFFASVQISYFRFYIYSYHFFINYVSSITIFSFTSANQFLLSGFFLPIFFFNSRSHPSVFLSYNFLPTYLRSFFILRCYFASSFRYIVQLPPILKLHHSRSSFFCFSSLLFPNFSSTLPITFRFHFILLFFIFSSPFLRVSSSFFSFLFYCLLPTPFLSVLKCIALSFLSSLSFSRFCRLSFLRPNYVATFILFLRSPSLPHGEKPFLLIFLLHF